MYDSVYMRLETDEPIYKYFQNTKETLDSMGYMSFQGYCQNMRLFQNPSGVSIAGSLQKLVYGSNAVYFNRQDTKNAIELLSDNLHIPVINANVFSLEIASNFIMKNPVNQYLWALNNLPYFKNMPIENESRYFLTQTKSLKFYDKNAELKKKKEIIPEIYQGRNILRYEMKVKKRLSAFFIMPEIKAETLYSESFYIKALEAWKHYYFKIEKRKLILIKEVEIMQNTKKFFEQMALIGMKSIGFDNIEQNINLARPELTRLQYSRLKKKIKELSNSKDYTEPLEVVQELDKKVRQAVMYYR